jgi:ribokinase
MTRPRIVVLGSANMDLVVTVPSAPGRGETVTGTSFHTGPGGKGANQAIAARRAGADVTFLGAVGDDEYGARIRTLLAADGVDVSGLTTSDQPTGTAHIVVDNAGENSIIVVPGANGTMRSLTAEHRDRIAAADVLLLQLELPLEVVAQAARFARANGVWTVLTPAPARELPPEVLASVELLVPNQHEATALTGTVDPDEAGRSLQQRSGQVLITLGERGSRYFGPNEEPISVPAFAVPAVDTTAAGDGFVGAFAVARSAGADLRSAIRRATAAAAIAVGRPGASSALAFGAEIDQFLKDHPE